MARTWLWIAAAGILVPAAVYVAYVPLSGAGSLPRLAEPKHAYAPLKVAEMYDQSHLLRIQHEKRLDSDMPDDGTGYTPEELRQMYEEMYGEPVEKVGDNYLPVSWNKSPIPPVQDWLSGSRSAFKADMLATIETTFLEKVRLLNPKGMLSADLFSRCPSGYGYYEEDENGEKDGNCWFALVYWDGCDEDRMCTFRYTISDQTIMVKLEDSKELISVEYYIASLATNSTV